MKYKAIYATIAVVGGCLLSGGSSQAAAVRCSGEYKTCAANCVKIPNNPSAPVCITNCRTRQTMCMQTGCWDSGTSRYCGILRK